MSYIRGALVAVDVELRNEAGELADPTELKLLIRRPAGATVTRTWPSGEGIVRDEKGHFHSQVSLDEDDLWECRWEPTGNVQAPSRPIQLYVEPDDFDGEANPLRALTPSTAEVAVHMRARLLNEHGADFEDFNEETEPTKAQIEALIPKAVRRVRDEVGRVCPGAHLAVLQESQRDAAALLTATMAERTYFPEQVGSQRSPYNVMYQEYKDSLEGLKASKAEHCSGDADGDGAPDASPSQMPRSSFPCPKGFEREEW
jgi:hypothetical protein